MLGAFLLHSMAVVAGALQNFMSRRRIRQWSSVLCQRLVHRDSEVTEDVGFLAGNDGISCAPQLFVSVGVAHWVLWQQQLIDPKYKLVIYPNCLTISASSGYVI